MNLKTTPAGVLFCIASLLAVPALQAADDDTLGIAGRWTPDASANRWLTMPSGAEGKEAGSTGSNGRGGPPGMGGRSGDGPPGGGGGQGGQPPGGGGGRPGGGPPGAGGPPPGGGGASRPDIELEAARLAAPPFEDLLLVAEGGKLLIGGDAQIQIPLNGTRVLLADGSTQASLFTENGDYVLEFDAGDGFKVSYTYRLEGGGKRLRVISVTQHPSLWKPQETQKLYRRTPDAEPVPPAPAS